MDVDSFCKDPLLVIKNLDVTYAAKGEETAALCGICLEICAKEVVGVLGESGSGKTTLGTAIVGGLPTGSAIKSGLIQLAGVETSSLDEKAWQRIRGRVVSMIWQEPRIALNPVMRVGVQVAEVVRAHNKWSSSKCKDAAMSALTDVHLDAAKIFDAFPHELSGGQCQRVAIAQAIVCNPQLIIADEPTSALDSTVQTGILDLIAELRERTQTAFLLITHNPAILRRLADRILVMNAGRIVEQGGAAEVLAHPSHPYTKKLLESRGKLLQSATFHR